MFKWANKPTWHTPFMDKKLVIAKWVIPGKVLPEMEICHDGENSQTHEWVYGH